MMRSLRLLPLTMVVAFLLLGLTIGDAVRDGLLFAHGAYAQSEKPAPSPASSGEAKPPEKKEEAPKTAPAATPEEESDEEAPQPKHEFSQVEVDLLQSLAKRREELDDWQKKIQLKENMLIATEQRINDKINNLQRMKKEIEDLLAQYNEQEDTKIRSLVKIYENMKPKDAARIFEELDMPVLLLVVDRMSERKVAPVLAAMTPEKAKNVTIQLAEQRKLKKPRATTTPVPGENSGATDNANAPAVDSAAPAADNAAVGSAPPLTDTPAPATAGR